MLKHWICGTTLALGLAAVASPAMAQKDLPPPQPIYGNLSSTYPGMSRRALAYKRTDLIAEARSLQEKDGGTLSAEHLAYLREKAARLNRETAALDAAYGMR